MKRIKSVVLSIIGFVAVLFVYLFITSIGYGNGTFNLETLLDELKLVISTEENGLIPREDVDDQGHYHRGDYIEASVERVIDGDTLVAIVDGESIRVRLSGVDTPESVGAYKGHPEVYGEEASSYTKELIEGKRVWLEEDVKTKDKYDRLLMYVWLEDPLTTSLPVGCVNALLLLEGYGTWFNDHENQVYAEKFQAYEALAEEASKGIWQKH